MRKRNGFSLSPPFHWLACTGVPVQRSMFRVLHHAAGTNAQAVKVGGGGGGGAVSHPQISVLGLTCVRLTHLLHSKEEYTCLYSAAVLVQGDP